MRPISENTYFKAKALNPKLQQKQQQSINSFKFSQGLTRLSQLEYLTEPTLDITQFHNGAQTDRTHIKKIKYPLKYQNKYRLELKSVILEEEKKQLQTKFMLLDSFTQRSSKHHIAEQISVTAQNSTRNKDYINNKQKLSEYEELNVKLKRNVFFYTSIKIKEKYSPVQVIIRIRDGDPNTKLRIFGSTKYIEPNRFNADIEVIGKLLKFTGTNEQFIEDTLYLALLSQNDLELSIRAEFSRPPVIVKKVIKDNFNVEQIPIEFTPNLNELIEEIMEKRRKRYASHNFIQQNRQVSSQQLRKKSDNSIVDIQRQLFVKDKIKTLQFQNTLKRQAQLQLHDVAREIHTRQLQMRRKIQNREYCQKTWLTMIALINHLAPAINIYIENQRTIVAKNVKKQILLIQMFMKIQRRVNLFGPNVKLRIVAQSKLCLEMIAQNSRQVAKKRAEFIVTELLKNNIRAFITENQGTQVVNIIKTCISRLVKHKNSRIQFMSDLKLFLSFQYRHLYNDALRYSKLTEVPKNKRDPIHFLLHDSSFIHQMTKKILNLVFEKWNTNFQLYRIAIRDERIRNQRKGLALFWQPPKLFEIPHENVVRIMLFEELERKGLITSDYRT